MRYAIYDPVTHPVRSYFEKHRGETVEIMEEMFLTDDVRDCAKVRFPDGTWTTTAWSSLTEVSALEMLAEADK